MNDSQSSARIRVLHIYKDYYPPVCGGIEMYMASLCSALRNHADVEVLVCGRRFSTRHRVVDGVPVTEAGELGRLLSSPISPAFPFCLRKARFDILHFHVPNPWAVASYWAARPQGKVVVQYHSDIVRQARMLRLYDPLLRWFLRRAGVVAATSPQYVQSSPYLSAVEEKCRVVPLGTDLAALSFSDERRTAAAALSARYGGRFILFVGVLRYYKGLPYLLEAMRRVECRLVIVGGGPEENSLKSMARESGLADKVTFTGTVSEEEKIVHLHACDLFVLPSSERSEAYGLSMVEALACGKPAVSTRLGTGVEFVNVDGETGINVEPRDPQALADAINRLLGDDTLRERLGVRARARALETFNMADNVRSFLEIYRELMEN